MQCFTIAAVIGFAFLPMIVIFILSRKIDKILKG